MFERFEYKAGSFPASQKYYYLNIIDSTFTEEVIAEIIPGEGIDIMTPLIDLYESKGLNVGANITKAYIYMCERYTLEPKQYLTNLIKLNKSVEKYKDDIEKYLVLI